jgi:F-type H+/Na+-transporting ATPase subunit alpha
MSDLVLEIEEYLRGVKTETARVTVGSVREVGDGIARIEGLGDVMLNEMLDFGGGVTRDRGRGHHPR